MPARSVQLAQVRVASPCTEDWDAMDGQGTRRFCRKCDKHVHDLSQMTATEAEQVVAGAAVGHVCVRYEVADDGGAATLEYAKPPPRPRFRAKVWWPIALVASGAAAIVNTLMPAKPVAPARALLGAVRITAPTVQPSVMMGDIAPCPPTTRPSDE